MSEPIKSSVGDPWIIAQLDEARRRNSSGTNPNKRRGRMIFDFGIGKIRIEEAPGSLQ